MHKYIDKIVHVFGDGNYEFHVVLEITSMWKVNHTLVCQHLINKLTSHKKDYMKLYENTQ